MLDTPDEGRLLDKEKVVRSNKQAVAAVASSKYVGAVASNKQQLQQEVVSPADGRDALTSSDPSVRQELQKIRAEAP